MVWPFSGLPGFPASKHHYILWVSKCGPGPAISAATLGSCPRPTPQTTPGLVPVICCHEPPGRFWGTLKLEGCHSLCTSLSALSFDVATLPALPLLLLHLSWSFSQECPFRLSVPWSILQDQTWVPLLFTLSYLSNQFCVLFGMIFFMLYTCFFPPS